MIRCLKNQLRRCASWHTADEKPVLVFASPRGGSTWISKLIFTQPGFCLVSEPLNVRRAVASRELGTDRFCDLYGEGGWRIIEPYYQRLLSGEIPEYRPLPGEWFYRFRLRRSVFKQNQGGGDLLDRMEARLGFKIIHLIRHPIAVAVSREVHPLLDEYGACALRGYFSDAQNYLADRIIEKGSHLEKGVLAWCLHHIPALNASVKDGLILSYENAVLDPDSTVEKLASFLEVADPDLMRSSIQEPSNVIGKSDAKTQALLSSAVNRGQLVSKWRDRVGEQEECELMEILAEFSCELYRAGEDMSL